MQRNDVQKTVGRGVVKGSENGIFFKGIAVVSKNGAKIAFMSVAVFAQVLDHLLAVFLHTAMAINDSCMKKKRAARERGRLKERCVKLDGRWYHKVRDQEKIKQKSSIARSKTRKRPATYRPSNMESWAHWLQKHDFPSKHGKTKKERKLGAFVHARRQA